MTQNEVNIIKNSVLDATEAYVDARLANANFVKTQIGVTKGNPTKNAKGKYEHTVVCNKTAGSSGTTYTKVLSVGNIAFPKESVVFIIAPNAQYSNQFILGKLDSSPANIVGGEIHIGEITGTNEYYFNVNSTGNVTIKGADSSIQLAQDGNTNYYHVNLDKNGIRLGHTSGSNYNFIVNASDGSVSINKGSITLSNKLKIDATGWLAIGGTTSASNFYVDTTGKVTAKNLEASVGGKIAGWTISANGLSYGSSAWVEPNKISCGSHGATHIEMLGKGTAGDNSGYLSVELNPGSDYVHVLYNSIYRSDDKYAYFIDGSDERLKKEIKDLSIDEAHLIIDNVKPKSFRYKKNDEIKHYGFIAQKIDKDCQKFGLENPFVRNGEMNDEYKMVDYIQFIAPLVKVVQEQQKEIDMLKSKLGV